MILSKEQKQLIQDMVLSQTFQLMLKKVEEGKPSVHILTSGISEKFDISLVNNRFHQMQGWEMLLMEIHKSYKNVELQTYQPLTETFPSEEINKE